MAGEWIAMSSDLWTSPEVVRLSAFCQQHVSATCNKLSARCVVVGALFRVWSIIDIHCDDGILVGYTPSDIDSEVGIDGWCQAMITVGWLTVLPQGIGVPGFEKWFSKSARRRRMNAVYQQNSRKARQQTVSNGADKMLTREEKRREELNPLNPPLAQGGNLLEEKKRKRRTRRRDEEPSKEELERLAKVDRERTAEMLAASRGHDGGGLPSDWKAAIVSTQATIEEQSA